MAKRLVPTLTEIEIAQLEDRISIQEELLKAASEGLGCTVDGLKTTVLPSRLNGVKGQAHIIMIGHENTTHFHHTDPATLEKLLCELIHSINELRESLRNKY